MSIVPTTSIIASRFSLVGLPPIASIPFAPAVVPFASDLPADLLSLSAAANDFILHSEEDESEPDTDADIAPSDSWPAYVVPMTGHTFSADLPSVAPQNAPLAADKADASDPVDTTEFASFDTGYADSGPSPKDEAYHLAFTLELDGIEADRPIEVSRDKEVSLRWSRGRFDARAVRLAREAAEREARDLLAAAGHGQATGWAGGPKIAPHGYTPAQCAAFHEGYLVGEAEFLKDCPEHASQEDDAADYGGQISRSIAESEANARESEYSFIV